ncbi:hypothetical protein DNH61_06835 [Paenibacillus sambharensis]|uniref:DUF2935 domain-containing protein n=1 Tax=Paenibacillus sambharensis TaxID=1803190 RepID=A0A2W1LYC5_9BACL|nr:DUF2935 domain-containing protein [Paenibacillus sambharensis]PZD96517.1 hypothetical protein DNH61_06835 [Paenibacillus sambharensis]
MQFYYGNQMPLRILDEAEFWKHQEEEHTVVIRELVQGLEQQYVEGLKQWENVLAATHQAVVRFIESVNRSGGSGPSPALYQEVMKLVHHCLNESHQFIGFCQHLKEHSVPVKENPTAIVVIDHIIRESEYFVGIAQTLLYAK